MFIVNREAKKAEAVIGSIVVERTATGGLVRRF